MADPAKEKTSIFNFEEEVQCVRADIRQSGMLSRPLEAQALVSLDGKLLHNDLVNMHVVLIDNYEKYKKSPNNCVLDPVFITSQEESEYNNVNTWTKDKIARKTLELINSMRDEDLSAYYRQVNADITPCTKAKLIEFYDEVSKALDDARADAEAVTLDDERADAE